MKDEIKQTKMAIQLSDHFNYRRLFRFTLPSIVMMVFTSVYGVVDGYFVSNYAGKTAFAAVNLIMPFIMILGGMGFMIGTGGTALVAKTMGEGDIKKANRYFSMMVSFTLVLGAVLTVLGIVFIEPVSRLLKASEEMLPSCITYGRIVIGSTIPFMLQNVFQSFLIAAERPKLGLAVTLAAGIANMVLDYLFVGVFGWGVAGAAIATAVSECVGGFVPFIYFLCPNKSILRLTRAKPEVTPILQSVWNGSSELMSNISASAISIIYNFQLLKYFGENGVSAYGVLMYVQFIFNAISIGYSVGSAPIISYHYGAENHGELKNMLKKSTVLTAVSGVVLAGLAFSLAPILAKIFVGYDPDLFDLTKGAFRLFSASFILTGFNIFSSSFFTALNDGFVSAAISFLRTLLFQTLSVMLLPLILGVNGIWLAKAAAEVLTLAVSLVFFFWKREKYKYF